MSRLYAVKGVSMKVVVGGAGKLGSSLIHELYHEGHKVTVIDTIEATLDKIQNQEDVQTVVGSITSIDIQQEADVKNCDVFIAATDSDEVNVTGAIIARMLGAKHTMARMRDIEYASYTGFVRDSLGISYLMNPEYDVARHLAEMLEYPAVYGLERFISGNITMMEGVPRQGSHLIGMNLRSFRRHYPSLIITAVERDNDVFIPGGDFTLQGHDRILATGLSQDLRELYSEFANNRTRLESVLIVGGGRIAHYLLGRIHRSHFKITLIERDEARAMALAAEFPEVRVIIGDGTDLTVLDELQLEKLDIMFALTGMDEQNVMLSLYADSKGVTRTVCKVNRTNMLPLLSSLGLQTIITPHSLAAVGAMRYIRSRDSAQAFAMDAHYRLMNDRVNVLEYKLLKESNLLGIPISELSLHPETLVAFIYRKGKIIFPQGSDVFHKGDRIALVTKSTQHTDLEELIWT